MATTARMTQPIGLRICLSGKVEMVERKEWFLRN
jgi:hypothetical protein